MKPIIICERICLIGLLVIAFALLAVKLFAIESLIQQQAADGAKMLNSTYKLWGVIPGDTQTYTIRNFTLFNFTNPHAFLYQESVVPQFTEISGFVYQELNQFINYHYSDGDNLIGYDYWLHFDLLKESRDVDQKFNVINVAPLGFWMQLDTVPISTFTLQGFGGLFVEMNATIKCQAIGQGVSSVFLQTYEFFKLVCNNQEISTDKCWSIWNDPNYGLNNIANYQPWVNAAYYQQQQSRDFLYSYFFPFAQLQFQGLLTQLSRLCSAVDRIISNYYCGSSNCTGYELTIKQLSKAAVTNDPPSGTASESICSMNVTCIGSPEVVTFLHHEFKQKHPEEWYQELQFSEECISYLFTPYKGLLNIGYIQDLYTLGVSYDQTKSQHTLSQMTEHLHSQSDNHTFVLWQWVKYMTEEFVLKTSKGGSRKIAGFGAISSAALYQSTQNFASLFLHDVYSFLASKMIEDNCVSVLEGFQLTPMVAESICESVSPSSYQSYYSLLEPCLNLTGRDQFMTRYKMSALEMQNYCDMDEQSSNMGNITLSILQQVYTHYNCSESYQMKCTEIEIIAKQLIHSSITLKPIDEKYPKQASLTANSWFKSVPTFEYQHWLHLAAIKDPQQHTEAEIRDLYSFDKLLNGPAVQELMLVQDEHAFSKNYHWANPSLLKDYLRYIVIEAGFGGFTQSRSAKEMFFGYEDPFLSNLKATDPMQGGDPSLVTLISFNQLNSTADEAKFYKQKMFTGNNDSSMVREFSSIFNRSYICVNKTSFDGDTVNWDLVSPWREQVPLQGTDGFQVPPNSQPGDNPYIYISSIARFSPINYTGSLEKDDMQLYDFRINRSTLESQYQNPDNAKYYQTFEGLLNQSYQGFPLMASKTHFLDTSPLWSQRINLIDEAGNPMEASEWDDTRLFIEPYTGTAFSATLSLQSNYYYLPDLLFPESQKTDSKERLLPITNTLRSGNVSSSAVDQFFGDLRFALAARRGLGLLSFVIIGLCCLIFIGCRIRRGLQPEAKKPSLLESSAYQSQAPVK